MEEGILKQLELTRELMIRSGIENGLQNAKTIRLSQQLDKLLNIYRTQVQQKPVDLHKQSFS